MICAAGEGGEDGSGGGGAAGSPPAAPSQPPRVPVGIITTDFAMQNVALQLGLRLLTHGGKTVSSVKAWVLKCDACFSIFSMHGLKAADALFCKRCGNATLARLGVTLGPDGAPRYHYKKFRQVSTRGTVYPIPAPEGGRLGGGKAALLLRPDQLLTGGWKERMRHAERAKKDAEGAMEWGAEGGGNGWGSGWAAPSSSRLEELPDVRVGYGHRNPNAGRGKKK
jgi:hypothetical protein